MTLFLKRVAAGLVITILTLLVPIALFAFVAFFPILTCHGEGAGGNCGEGLMASLPLALLLIPLDIYAMVVTGNCLTRWIWPKASPPPLPPFS
jgi:hypothetical protein